MKYFYCCQRKRLERFQYLRNFYAKISVVRCVLNWSTAGASLLENTVGSDHNKCSLKYPTYSSDIGRHSVNISNPQDEND